MSKTAVSAVTLEKTSYLHRQLHSAEIPRDSFFVEDDFSFFFLEIFDLNMIPQCCSV